jgi:hypothetical protein
MSASGSFAGERHFLRALDATTTQVSLLLGRIE